MSKMLLKKSQLFGLFFYDVIKNGQTLWDTLYKSFFQFFCNTCYIHILRLLNTMVCLKFESKVIQGHQRSNKEVNFFRATFFAKHSIYYTLKYAFINWNTYQHEEYVILHHSAKFYGFSVIFKVTANNWIENIGGKSLNINIFCINSTKKYQLWPGKWSYIHETWLNDA